VEKEKEVEEGKRWKKEEIIVDQKMGTKQIYQIIKKWKGKENYEENEELRKTKMKEGKDVDVK
jgi:hypothetical protein